MGISFFTNHPCTMVAAQVYLALCVAGVAVAAPQLDFGGLRSVTTTREVATNNVDEAQVVSSVVSAQPPSPQPPPPPSPPWLLPTLLLHRRQQLLALMLDLWPRLSTTLGIRLLTMMLRLTSPSLRTGTGTT